MVKPNVAIGQHHAVTDNQKLDAATILKNAKAEWTQAVDKANAELKASFDKAHADAVSAHDGYSAQAITADKKAFDQQKVYPRSKAMRPYLENYLKHRATAADAFVRAYDEAVVASKNGLDVAMTDAIVEQKSEFIAGEEKAKEAIATGTPLPEAAMKTTEYLAELSTRLRARIDAIAHLDTSVKRDEGHAAMMRDFDTELQKKSLAFHFPIKDVQHSYEGKFTFSLSQPDEVANIGQSGFLNSLTVDFPPAEVARIHPGDVLVLSGTARLRANQNGSGGFGPAVQGMQSIIHVDSAVTNQSYEIVLQNFKVRIEHK